MARKKGHKIVGGAAAVASKNSKKGVRAAAGRAKGAKRGASASRSSKGKRLY